METSKVISVLEKARTLAASKEQIENDLKLLREGKVTKVSTLSVEHTSLRLGRHKTSVTDRLEWFDGEKFFSKIKYLLIAELEESLEKVNRELEQYVTIKEPVDDEEDEDDEVPVDYDRPTIPPTPKKRKKGML